jgi:hypothetical protein
MAAIVTTLRRRKERLLRNENALLSSEPSVPAPLLSEDNAEGSPSSRFFQLPVDNGDCAETPLESANGLLSKIRSLQSINVMRTKSLQQADARSFRSAHAQKRWEAAERIQRVFRGFQLRKIVVAIHADAFCLSQSSVRTVVGMVRANVKGWDLLCAHILYTLLFILMAASQLSMRTPDSFSTHSALREAFRGATFDDDGGGIQDVSSPQDAIDFLGK